MKRTSILMQFVPIFLPLAFTVAFISYLLFTLEINHDRALLMAREGDLVKGMKSIILKEIDLVKSDLLVLSENRHLHLLIQKDSKENRENLTRDFLSISKRKMVYDQIRFIKKNGQEVIRVNYNNGNPTAVPRVKLQNKKDRYYFSSTLTMSPEQIFLSPLDLNVEHGKIEKPLKPMLRFGTPVFDQTGASAGIVLFNFQGKRLLSSVKKMAFGTSGDLLFVNKDGFFITGPTTADEWGFMLKDRKDKTFPNAYSQSVWEQVLNAKSVQLNNSMGLFSFETLYPLSESGEQYFWKLGTFVPQGVVSSKSESFLFGLIVFNSVTLPLIGVLSWLLTKNRVKRMKALDDLKEANRMKDVFIDIIQHDLRNPVAFISSLSKQVLKKEEQEEKKGFLRAISSKSESIVEMIDNASQLARLDAGKKLAFKKENIVDYLQAVTDDVEPLAAAKSISVTNVYDEICESLLNPLIYDVFQNLVTNAIKYSPEGTKIKIEIKECPDVWKIQVVDEGEGIADAHKQTVFNRFQRLNKGGVKGTGLGLAISKKIVDAHGGRIFVEDNEPEGSIFVVELPRYSEKKAL